MSLYESGLKAKWDYDNTIAFAHGEGVEEGVEIGIEIGVEMSVEKGKYEEKKNTATKLKEMGIPIDNIVQITGLTATEIEKL